MSDADEFRPELSRLRTRVHHVKASELSSDTAQTARMLRLAAITGKSAGSQLIWMGETYVSPQTVSGNHHHGPSETAIFVRKGNPVFVFHDGAEEVRVVTEPGDYVFVPPYVPHREENPDPVNPAVIVVARTTQEAIVVSLTQLYAVSPQGDSQP